MLFEQKKISVETLSEYLASVRISLNFSLEQVSGKTGIKLKFLQSLEKGDFKLLPADVYVLGFLRQLGQLYQVSPGELIEQYKKEKNIQKQVFKQNQLFKGGWPKSIFGKLVITPKILGVVLGLAFVVLTLGYIIWQLWSIDKTPALLVLEPQNNSVISAAFVEVSGHTDPGADVSVNGINIFVDSKGSFQTQAAVSPGPEEITIMAYNRFGKSVSRAINITGAVGNGTSVSGPLQLNLSFTGLVTITFSIDNQSPQTLNFSSGDSKTFFAQQKIFISTSDAGATKVSVNGQNLGAMGRPKELLSNVPFFAQPATTTPGM
jgi:transcriptional regulator with XRE-family HTH domain